MLFRKREPRSSGARRRGEFRPAGDSLEGRLLLAIDLGGAAPPQLPLIATAPVGINMAGTIAGAGAGFSVANVGDVNTDGFDDFLVGAPTVGNTGGIIVPASGVPTVYLIYGSRTTTSTTIVDWLNNNATQRVGDLNQLGNSSAGQQNPITGVAGYPFDGIKIVTSQTTGSQLGASVAAVTVNGVRSLMIGAPGHRDLNGNNPGTGRAYLIYGGNALNNVPNKTLDLDNPLGAANVSVVTFVSSNTGSNLGRAVAGTGDVIVDGVNDLALGAPNATINGLAGAGAVYLLSGLDVPSSTTTVNVLAIGQSSGLRGVVFAGASAGAQAGWSIAGAGNVDGAVSGTSLQTGDLLIGAPANTSGTPAAYLVYGTTNLQNQQITTNNYSFISLGRVGASGATGVSGLAVSGSSGTDQTGWAVASAGDFNGDGLADIMIGSPGYQSDRGRVDLFYGQSVSGTPLQGQITLDSSTISFPNLVLTGASTSDLAGYALSPVGRINSTLGNPIIIGAPGFASDFGTAYLLPSQPSQLEGRFSLASAESQPVAATQLTLTTPGTPTFPAFFGASVSGRLTVSGQSRTADGDLLGDFIVGAPGYTVSTPGRNIAGGVFILEGAFTPLKVPVSTAITTTIGVEKPFGPFTNIDPTSPAAMSIYVFSNANITPAFAPVTQIDPTTVTVNGVSFANATIAADPVDENKDGIPDAIVTITPRANIGLTSSTTSLTIAGRTKTTGTNANQRWTGTAAITVAGGGNNGGGGGVGSSVTPVGQLTPTTFVPPFGPDRYVPPVSALSRLGSYKAIPYRVAVQQYMPQQGFTQRMVQYYFPKTYERQFGSRNRYTGSRTSTLSQAVFTRGKWHAGDVKTFTHKEHVVPSTLQTERLGGQPRPWYQIHPKG